MNSWTWGRMTSPSDMAAKKGSDVSEYCHSLDRRQRTGSRKEETTLAQLHEVSRDLGMTLSDEDAARDRGLERMAASLYEARG